MKLKAIVHEDFVNYKEPALFLATCECDFKCCKEGGFDVEICQNSELACQQAMDIPVDKICQMYLSNPITKAIVVGGLEPFMSFGELQELVSEVRGAGCLDPIVIYTGYYMSELVEQIDWLKQYDNIIIKFGRYVPNHKPHYDEVLGIDLVSDTQYAERIS